MNETLGENATTISIMNNLVGSMSQQELIIFGIMAIVILVMAIAIFVILRRKDEPVPDTLPPLKDNIPVPEPPHQDFRKMLDSEITYATQRRKQIESQVKLLEAEYKQIKSDLIKLDIIRKGMQ